MNDKMKKILPLTVVLALGVITVLGNTFKENSEMKKVTFKRDDLTLVGNLYLPRDFDENKKYPSVIVGGSLTSVKEQMAGTYAAKLAGQGILSLAFDYSHYGESDGLPRQFEDPEVKLKDMEAAVTYLLSLPYVEQVGALGVCTSGGNVAYLAEGDSRVGAIVTVAAWLPNEEVLPLLYGSAENVENLKNRGEQALNLYNSTGKNELILAYSNTDKTASHFGPMEYYMDMSRGGGVKQWENSFSVISWPTWLAFDPMSKAQNISTPVMVIHSDGSALPDNAKTFYEKLTGEKELIWLDGYHFDFYDQEKQVKSAVENASDFFKKHLD